MRTSRQITAQKSYLHGYDFDISTLAPAKVILLHFMVRFVFLWNSIRLFLELTDGGPVLRNYFQ